MAFYWKNNPDPTRHCIRHGCKNSPEYRVATSRWWKLNDRKANDGITGIVFECCSEHMGSWKEWAKHSNAAPDLDAREGK